MALIVKDRVKETTTTTGTGTITLAGADSGFQTFSAIGDGNTTYYAIQSGNNWEVGLGTYTLSGTTLSRTTILESSNAGSAITLSGTSDVFCTYPAEKAVALNGTVINDANVVATANIVDDAVTADKLANSINAEIAANTAKTGITSGQAGEITANTAKVTNATHTGDVTGATALTIASNAVTADKINVTGDGTSGQYLTSDGDGSMTWLTPPAGGVPSGTKQLFVQTAAPTGWTKDTTHNDKALRIVSGAASSGGTVAFETAFASKTPTGSVTITAVSGSAGATTLSTAQMPSHTHAGSLLTAGSQYPSPSTAPYSSYNFGNMGATGGNGSHSHAFSFSSGSGTFSGAAIDLDVSYVDVIIATKD